MAGRRKKHALPPGPLQKTPATVAKNTSHGNRRKNTKTSHRRKKHELPTQKTRNPKTIDPNFLGHWGYLLTHRETKIPSPKRPGAHPVVMRGRTWRNDNRH